MCPSPRCSGIGGAARTYIKRAGDFGYRRRWRRREEGEIGYIDERRREESRGKGIGVSARVFSKREGRFTGIDAWPPWLVAFVKYI